MLERYPDGIDKARRWQRLAGSGLSERRHLLPYIRDREQISPPAKDGRRRKGLGQSPNSSPSSDLI
jgi:hypothetical protein